MNSPIDHRVEIAKLDLGHIEEHSPGLIHWHPNGQRVINKMKNLLRDLHQDKGYQEVSSPIIMSKSLWERSGHWEKYHSNMFVVASSESNKDNYAIKPMSCPGHIAIYDHQPRSYRDLPWKMFEFGHVHRNESSGALSGWMRLRGFVQDDSHIILEQRDVESVVKSIIEMFHQVYPVFGFAKWSWKLSLRPEQRSGSDEQWDISEQALRDAARKANIEPIDVHGGGAFYGPKLEAILEDRHGRSWQCGVIQLDSVLPERFDLAFNNAKGQRERPVMIHHAVVGSLERWLAIVLENQGSLPDWLHPHPLAIIPVSSKHLEQARLLQQQARHHGILSLLVEDGPLPGRIKKVCHLPHHWVIGDKEVSGNSVSWRHDANSIQVVHVQEAMMVLHKKVQPPW